MAGNRRGLSISWPFAPTAVRLNGDTGLLKLVAMLAMFCDHAGKMLFPQYPIMRIIGRLAFPIYAYCLAVGCYGRDNCDNICLCVGDTVFVYARIYTAARLEPRNGYCVKLYFGGDSGLCECRGASKYSHCCRSTRLERI